MLKRFLGLWRSGEDKPLLSDPHEIKRTYERRRRSVLLSVVFGYGIFYIGRLTISVAKKPMIDAGIMDATQIGIIGSLLFYAYAFGKLTNGFLADRANIAKFMATLSPTARRPMVFPMSRTTSRITRPAQPARNPSGTSSWRCSRAPS